jgi:cation diffusion facilitator CzcD-associated flavoprotein CzcO
MHSANVKKSIDFTDKRVAVIGIGSSGIQAVSTLSAKVKQLYTWVRSPTWITAGFAQRFAGINGGNYKCELSFLRFSNL